MKIIKLMFKDYQEKLNKLSPTLQAKLSSDDFLAKLDELDTQYGIKAALLLLNLLAGEIEFTDLKDKLVADYSFNDFLAEEIKDKFGVLIKELGEASLPLMSAAARKTGSEKISPVSRSAMTFSQSDTEEVRKYIDLSTVAPADYTSQAKELVAELGWRSADEITAKRLENIIISRIKDIRDDLETKETLMKSRKVGGMEFSENEADRLVVVIKDRLVSSSASTQRVGETVNSFSQPVIEMEDGLPVVRLPEDLLAYNQSALINERGVSAVGQTKKQEESLPTSAEAVKINPTTEEKLPPPSPQPFIAAKKIPESVLNAKTVSRPNLDGVNWEKKLKGPIEELETMTVIDFRRLAADPQAAVNEIKEKVDLLEKESYNRRLEGIAAWQRSEVNRFYRLLGQLSMSEGKKIEEVIRERLLAGKPTLSLDEFNAVMELNRALRY